MSDERRAERGRGRGRKRLPGREAGGHEGLQRRPVCGRPPVVHGALGAGERQGGGWGGGGEAYWALRRENEG